MEKHPVLTRILLTFLLCVVAFLVILPGFLIFLYKCPFEIETVVNAWVNEGTLGYYIAALSSLSTIALSCVTVWQTMLLARRTEQRENENIKRPFFAVEEVLQTHKQGKQKKPQSDQNGFILCDNKDSICLKIKNIGDGPAAYCLVNPITNCFGEDLDSIVQLEYATENGTMTIILPSGPFVSKCESRTLSVYYTSLVGCVYKQNIVITKEPIIQDDSESTISIKISPLSPQEAQHNMFFF